MTYEKAYLVSLLSCQNKDAFIDNLKSIDYDDYSYFITNFINDTKKYFYNCSEEIYRKMSAKWELEENIFLDYFN